jgi:8-oxo-dGTP pyrophosphatase MutT (NUDIX family)
MRWKTLGTRALYRSDWLELDLDRVELPDGALIDHHAVRFPRASVATVVSDGSRVLLLWRHRYIPDAWTWEVPCGWRDEGEDPAAAAAREVEEETGWRPGPLALIGRFHGLPGICDSRFHVFQAAGATEVGPPSDRNEAARVAWLPLADLPALVARGELTDGPTLAALTLARMVGP